MDFLMDSPQSLAAAFAVGLFGTMHCIGMCGPFVAFAVGSTDTQQSRTHLQLAYHGGRLVTYTLLGIAPGELVKRLVQSIVARDPAAALAHLDQSLSGGAEVGQLIDQLLGYFRDVMAMVVGCDTSQLRYVLPSQYEATTELGQKLGVHTVLAMIQVLDQTSARMRASCCCPGAWRSSRARRSARWPG